MRHERDLESVPDDELLRRLTEILVRSHQIEADLVAHIAEVDERRLWAREGAPSMYGYCTEVLHLSEPVTWLRIRAARASRKHPVLLEMLRDGRIHLTGIALLTPHLTPQNAEGLLRRATHKSKRQIEEIVAEVAPRPDARATMRKLPVPRGGPPPRPLRPDTVAGSEAQDCPDPAIPARPREASPAGAGKGGVGSPCAALRPDAVAASPDTAPPRPPTVEPLAPARYRVQFTAGQELHDKLERLQSLLRSSVPNGDLAAVIDVAVTRELQRLEARRFARAKAPRKGLSESDTTPKGRHIPAAVRRTVEKRDGGRCTFRSRSGRRCSRRHDLEFHHRVPFGRGGPHTPENLTLLCRAHNRLLGERDYGKEVMARRGAPAKPRLSSHPGHARTQPSPVPLQAQVRGSAPG